MNVWTRALILFTLACYVAVSSIAAAHAFPSNLKAGNVSPNDSSEYSMNVALVDMSPDCHQQVLNDIETNSVSACKIFCSCLSNIIIPQFVFSFPSIDISSEIAFVQTDRSKHAPRLEPHPPK